MNLEQIKKNIKYGDYDILQKLLKTSSVSVAKRKFLRGDKEAVEAMMLIQENRTIFPYLHDELYELENLIEALNNKADINELTNVLNKVDQLGIDYKDKVNRDGSNAIGDLSDSIDKRHLHSNKTVLDKVTQKIIDNSHIHTNKVLLDTYNHTNAEITDAIDLKHIHNNKALLDAITASYTTADDQLLNALAGIQFESDQKNAVLRIKDGNNNFLTSISLAYLNNEGTTFVYNQIKNTLDLVNDYQEVLSSIPVSSFVTNLVSNANWNGTTPSRLDFKDNAGIILFSIDYNFDNINGLQDNLKKKLDTDGSNLTNIKGWKDTLGISNDNYIPYTGAARSVDLGENVIIANEHCVYDKFRDANCYFSVDGFGGELGLLHESISEKPWLLAGYYYDDQDHLVLGGDYKNRNQGIFVSTNTNNIGINKKNPEKALDINGGIQTNEGIFVNNPNADIVPLKNFSLRQNPTDMNTIGMYVTVNGVEDYIMDYSYYSASNNSITFNNSFGGILSFRNQNDYFNEVQISKKNLNVGVKYDFENTDYRLYVNGATYINGHIDTQNHGSSAEWFKAYQSLANKANINGSNTTGGNWNIDGVEAPSLNTTNKKIFQATGNSVYFGNPELNSINFESIGELNHHKNGVYGKIWSSHNFNPDTKFSVYNNVGGSSLSYLNGGGKAFGINDLPLGQNQYGPFFTFGSTDNNYRVDFSAQHTKNGILSYRITGDGGVGHFYTFASREWANTTFITINEVNNQLNAKANTRLSNVVSDLTIEERQALQAKLGFVPMKGDVTMGGVKTFLESPVVPNATTNTHAVNLAQLNTKADNDNTITINGFTQALGSNPNFIISTSSSNPSREYDFYDANNEDYTKFGISSYETEEKTGVMISFFNPKSDKWEDIFEGNGSNGAAIYRDIMFSPFTQVCVYNPQTGHEVTRGTIKVPNPPKVEFEKQQYHLCLVYRSSTSNSETHLEGFIKILNTFDIVDIKGADGDKMFNGIYKIGYFTQHGTLVVNPEFL